MIRKFKLGDIVTYCGDVGIISEVRGIHPANGIPLYDFTYDGGKLSNNLLSTFIREDLITKIQPIKTDKIMTDRKKCEELHDKIVTAFGEQSGGEYNDTMYYQVLGAIEELYAAEEDDDWAYALKNLTECWKYVKHLAKIDEMQNNIPSEIYS